MHICFIGQYPYRDQSAGGVGTFTQNLAGALLEQGYKVSVIAYYPGVTEETTLIRGVNVHWIDQHKWPIFNFIRNSIATFRTLRQIHKAHPVDVAESAEAGFAFLPKIKGVAYIIRLHGGHHFFAAALGKPPNSFKAWKEKRSFRRADGYIAVSNYVLNKTASLFPFDLKRAVVIPNPVNTLQFYEANTANTIANRIVFVGRLVEKKGIRQLLQAMETVHNQFPDVQLFVYGGDTTMDKGSSFLAMLKEYLPNNLANNIIFAGEIPNAALPQKIEEAMFCVFPSHMEAMPIAWLEVMAMGKALIAGQTGPGPEVIENGIDGLLCDPHNPRDIAEKMLYLLNNPEKSAVLGRKARKKIVAQYDLPIITRSNMEFYESTGKRGG